MQRFSAAVSIRGEITSSAFRLGRFLFRSGAGCYGLIALCLLPLQAVGEGPADNKLSPFLDEIDQSRAKLLKSGTCSGNLSILLKKYDERQPATLVDCDFTVAFDGDKFRLEREYQVNNLTNEHQRGAWGIEANGCVRSIVISNGADNYWAKFDATDKPTCFLLTRQWCDLLLRNLDSPAPHPIRIWERASRMLRREDLVFSATPLQSGGILSRSRSDNWSVECYLLPPEPLCLSRVLMRTNGGSSECQLQWSQSAGVSYVESYSEHSVDRVANHSREFWLRVDYQPFTPNLAVDPESFALTTIGVPKGTKFSANAPIPSNYEFDGKTLVRLTNVR